MRTFGVGHDHGNSRTTDVVYVNGKVDMLTFPSATSTGSLQHLAKIRRATGDIDPVVDWQALKRDEYVFQMEGEFSRFVGNLALLDSDDMSMGYGNMTRYWNRRSLETLLTSSAMLIPDTDFELLVVTGLPVETFTEENRQKVKQALNGSYQFTVNGRKRHAVVKVGKVLMEGAGASLVYDQDVEDSDLVGLIDIGGYSTDLYVRQGYQAVTRLCRGIEIGVENAINLVDTWFRETYGFPLSATQKRDLLYASIDRIPYPKIQANGYRVSYIDLHKHMQQAIMQVAQKIGEEIAIRWKTGQTGKVAANFLNTLCIGGGAYYFADSLRTIIPSLDVPDEPEHANARGYAWFADQLLQQRSQREAIA